MKHKNNDNSQTSISAHHCILLGPDSIWRCPSYQYRKSHCGAKTVVTSSYLLNEISYNGKMASLYWTNLLVVAMAVQGRIWIGRFLIFVNVLRFLRIIIISNSCKTFVFFSIVYYTGPDVPYRIHIHFMIGYSDVIWASWRLKSPGTRMFFNSLFWQATLLAFCKGSNPYNSNLPFQCLLLLRIPTYQITAAWIPPPEPPVTYRNLLYWNWDDIKAIYNCDIQLLIAYCHIS